VSWGRFSLVAAILMLAGPSPAQTAISGEAALELIRQAMAQAGVQAPAMVAPRRGFPPCALPPAVRPLADDWSTAALDCDGPQPWRRVIRTGAPVLPRALQAAEAEAEAQSAQGPMVLSLTRPLPRGARIRPDDLTLIPYAGADPAQLLADPALATGRKLRRALGMGQPLLERHLDPALDIEPGQTVTVQLRHGLIDVATTATALAGGVTGGRIPVQPASGGDPLEAMIIAPGLVQVRPNMPRRMAVKSGKRRLSWSE
jgi:flagellar basal body P-ring formation protein FlgA